MIPKASLSVIFKRSEKYLHSCGVHPNITKIGLKYMLVFLLEHCGENLNGWSAFGACTMCKLESRALSVKRICIAYLQLYLPCSVKLVTAIDYYICHAFDSKLKKSKHGEEGTLVNLQWCAMSVHHLLPRSTWKWGGGGGKEFQKNQEG